MVLESLGYIAVNVETYNAFAGVKNDLLGFADIIAFHPKDKGVILVQVTDHDNGNARKKKILNSLEAYAWSSDIRGILLMTWKDNDFRLEPIVCADFADGILKSKLMAARAALAEIKVKELKIGRYI